MAGFSLILIGSNQGQRELIISQSIKMLAERCGEVFLLSSLYETEPWGFIAEQNFLNQVVALDTEMNPYDLLRELMMIEKELGRKRHDVEGYESRPIDLDILYYDDIIINDEDLILPHPRLHKRRFALMPLCDIAADFIHPVFKRSNRELLNECEDTSEVKLYK